MIEFARERQTKQTAKVIQKWPQLTELTESNILGSFSWFGMSTKTRLLFAPTLINIGGVLFTPADVARDYLRIKYPKPLRAFGAQLALCRQPRSAPLYAVPGDIENAVYLDLKAAFWSILRIVGWDAEYMPGRFLARRSSMDDFPFAGHKLARNCLVTAGLSSPQRVWSYRRQKIVFLKRGNPLANMVLWALVQDVLAGVASDVVSAGARYVHTDGYICPMDASKDVVDAVFRWGLPLDIRHAGSANIYAPGTYDIGEHIARRPTYARRYTNTIRELPYKTWLRDRFSRLARDLSD